MKWLNRNQKLRPLSVLLKLVEGLDGGEFQASDRKQGWEFYVLDRMPYEGKLYRLVWCMQEEAIFIGVINCFRR